MERESRSQKYQWTILEISMPTEWFKPIIVDDTVSEQYLDLKEQLNKAYWELLHQISTPNQLQIIKLTADGYTQTEIAKILNVNQSSVVKAISGNKEYGKYKGKTFGGIKKKAKNAAKKCEKIQAILAQMENI